MTPAEFANRLTELEAAAAGMEEPDKTFAEGDITLLRMEMEGARLDGLAAKIATMSLPEVSAIDAKIADARKATEDHQFRVGAFNGAIGLLKTAVGIVL